MNQRVRGIIISENKIALIERVKEGKRKYYVPGGGVEEGETLNQALLREMKEELGIDVAIGELLTEVHSEDLEGEEVINSFYLCTEIGGAFGAGDGPEYQPNNAYAVDGTHDPVWIPLLELKNIDLRPVEAQEMLVKKYC